MGGQCTTEAPGTLRLQDQTQATFSYKVSRNRPLSCTLRLLDSSYDTAKNCQLPICSYLLLNIDLCMHTLLHLLAAHNQPDL